MAGVSPYASAVAITSADVAVPARNVCDRVSNGGGGGAATQRTRTFIMVQEPNSIWLRMVLGLKTLLFCSAKPNGKPEAIPCSANELTLSAMLATKAVQIFSATKRLETTECANDQINLWSNAIPSPFEAPLVKHKTRAKARDYQNPPLSLWAICVSCRL